MSPKTQPSTWTPKQFLMLVPFFVCNQKDDAILVEPKDVARLLWKPCLFGKLHAQTGYFTNIHYIVLTRRTYKVVRLKKLGFGPFLNSNRC